MSEKTDVPSTNLENTQPPSEAGQSLESLRSLPDGLDAGAASSMSTIETEEPSGIEPTDGENAGRDKKYDISLFYAEDSEDEVRNFYEFLEFLLRDCGREARIWASFNDPANIGNSIYNALEYGLDNSNYYFLYIDKHFSYNNTMKQIDQWASLQKDLSFDKHITDARKRIVPIVTAKKYRPPFPAHIMIPMKVWQLTDGHDTDFGTFLESNDYLHSGRYTKNQLRYVDDLKRQLKHICDIEQESAQPGASNAAYGNASEYGDRELQSFPGKATGDGEVETSESNVRTSQGQQRTRQNSQKVEYDGPKPESFSEKVAGDGEVETSESNVRTSQGQQPKVDVRVHNEFNIFSGKWSPAILVLGGAAATALVATIYYNPPHKKIFSALLNWLVVKPILKKFF